MNTAFCTHCSDDWFYGGGCDKLLATAKHFHPDIPFYVFGTFELNKLNEKYNGGLSWDILNPVVSSELVKYNFDKIVHIDADSIILGKLNELLDFKTDLAVVRNNNDYDTASRFSDNPVLINNCKPENYFNAGLIASNNKEFWSYWIEQNKKAQGYPYKEQDILNLIVHSGKYTHNVLDPKEADCHYGISAHFGEKTFWDSSKEIVKNENDFFLRKKKVKVYHQAGGHHHFPKLNLSFLFNEQTAKDIQNIIDSTKATYEKIIL